MQDDNESYIPPIYPASLRHAENVIQRALKDHTRSHHVQRLNRNRTVSMQIKADEAKKKRVEHNLLYRHYPSNKIDEDAIPLGDDVDKSLIAEPKKQTDLTRPYSAIISNHSRPRLTSAQRTQRPISAHLVSVPNAIGREFDEGFQAISSDRTSPSKLCSIAERTCSGVDASSAVRSGWDSVMRMTHKILSPMSALVYPENTTEFEKGGAIRPASTKHVENGFKSSSNLQTTQADISVLPATHSAVIKHYAKGKAQDTKQGLQLDIEVALSHILGTSYDTPPVADVELTNERKNRHGLLYSKDIMHFIEGFCSTSTEKVIPKNLVSQIESASIDPYAFRFCWIDSYTDVQSLQNASKRIHEVASIMGDKSFLTCPWIEQIKSPIHDSLMKAKLLKGIVTGNDNVTDVKLSFIAAQIGIAKQNLSNSGQSDAWIVYRILASLGADLSGSLDFFQSNAGNIPMFTTQIDTLSYDQKCLVLALRDAVWRTPACIVEDHLHVSQRKSDKIDFASGKKRTKSSLLQHDHVESTNRIQSGSISAWMCESQVAISNPLLPNVSVQVSQTLTPLGKQHVSDSNDCDRVHEHNSHNANVNKWIDYFHKCRLLSQNDTEKVGLNQKISDIEVCLRSILCGLDPDEKIKNLSATDGKSTIASITKVIASLRHLLPSFSLHGSVAEGARTFSHLHELPEWLRKWYTEFCCPSTSCEAGKASRQSRLQEENEELNAGFNWLDSPESWEELRFYVDLGAVPLHALQIAARQRHRAWKDRIRWDTSFTEKAVPEPPLIIRDAPASSSLLHLSQFASIASCATSDTLPSKRAKAIVRILQTRKIGHPWSYWVHKPTFLETENGKKNEIVEYATALLGNVRNSTFKNQNINEDSIVQDMRQTLQSLDEYMNDDVGLVKTQEMLVLKPVLPKIVPFGDVSRLLQLISIPYTHTPLSMPRTLYEELPHSVRISILVLLSGIAAHPINALSMAEASCPSQISDNVFTRMTHEDSNSSSQKLLNVLSETALSDMRASIFSWNKFQENFGNSCEDEYFLREAGRAQLRLRQSFEAASFVVSLIGAISYSLTIHTPDEHDYDCGESALNQNDSANPSKSLLSSRKENSALTQHEVLTSRQGACRKSFEEASTLKELSRGGSKWQIARRLTAARDLFVEHCWIRSPKDASARQSDNIKSNQTPSIVPLQASNCLILMSLVNRIVTSSWVQDDLGFLFSPSDSMNRSLEANGGIASPIASYLTTGHVTTSEPSRVKALFENHSVVLIEARARLSFMLRSTSPVMALVWIALRFDTPWISGNSQEHLKIDGFSSNSCSKHHNTGGLIQSLKSAFDNAKKMCELVQQATYKVERVSNLMNRLKEKPGSENVSTSINLRSSWTSLSRAAGGEKGSLADAKIWGDLHKEQPNRVAILGSDPEIQKLALSIKQAAKLVKDRLQSLLPEFVLIWLEKGDVSDTDSTLKPEHVQQMTQNLEKTYGMSMKHPHLRFVSALRNAKVKPSRRALRILREAVLADLQLDSDGEYLPSNSIVRTNAYAPLFLDSQDQRVSQEIDKMNRLKIIESELWKASFLDSKNGDLSIESDSDDLFSDHGEKSPLGKVTAREEGTSSVHMGIESERAHHYTMLQEYCAKLESALSACKQYEASNLRSLKSSKTLLTNLIPRAMALLEQDSKWSEMNGPLYLSLACFLTNLEAVGIPPNALHLLSEAVDSITELSNFQARTAAKGAEITQRIQFCLQLVVSSLRIYNSERRFRIRAYRNALSGSLSTYHKLRTVRARRLWISPDDMDSLISPNELEKKMKSLVSDAARRARAMSVGHAEGNVGVISGVEVGPSKQIPLVFSSSVLPLSETSLKSKGRKAKQVEPKIPAEFLAADSTIPLEKLLQFGDESASVTTSTTNEGKGDIENEARGEELDNEDDGEIQDEEIAVVLFQDSSEAPCPAWATLLQRGVLVELSGVLALFARETLNSTLFLSPLLEGLLADRTHVKGHFEKPKSLLNTFVTQLMKAFKPFSAGMCSGIIAESSASQVSNCVTNGRALTYAITALLMLSLQAGAAPHLAYLNQSPSLAIEEIARDSLTLAPLQLLAVLRSDQCATIPSSSALYATSNSQMLYESLIKVNSPALRGALAELGLGRCSPALLPTRPLTPFDVSRWKHSEILFPISANNDDWDLKCSQKSYQPHIVSALAQGLDHRHISNLLSDTTALWHKLRTGQLHAKLCKEEEIGDISCESNSSAALQSHRLGKSLRHGILDHTLAHAFSSLDLASVVQLKAQHNLASLVSSSGSPLYQSNVSGKSSWLTDSSRLCMAAPEVCTSATLSLTLIGILSACNIWTQRVLGTRSENTRKAIDSRMRTDKVEQSESLKGSQPLSRRELFEQLILGWIRTGVCGDVATIAGMITNPVLGTPFVVNPTNQFNNYFPIASKADDQIGMSNLSPDEVMSLLENAPHIGASYAPFRTIECLAIERLEHMYTSYKFKSPMLSQSALWLSIATQTNWGISRSLQMASLRLIGRPIASDQGMIRLVSGQELLSSGHFDVALGLIGHPYPPIAALALEVVAHVTVPRKSQLSIATTVTTTKRLSAPVPGIFYLAEAMFRHNAKMEGEKAIEDMSSEESSLIGRLKGGVHSEKRVTSPKKGSEQGKGDVPDTSRKAALEAFSKTTTAISSTGSLITLYLDVDLERELGEELSLTLSEQEREALHREAVKKELLRAQKKAEAIGKGNSLRTHDDDDISPPLPTHLSNRLNSIVDVETNDTGNASSLTDSTSVIGSSSTSDKLTDESNPTAASLRALVPAQSLPKSYISRVMAHLESARRPPSLSKTWLDVVFQGFEQCIIGEVGLDSVLLEVQREREALKGNVQSSSNSNGSLKNLSATIAAPQLIECEIVQQKADANSSSESSTQKLLALLSTTAANKAFRPYRIFDQSMSRSLLNDGNLLALILVIQSSRTLQSRLLFDRLAFDSVAEVSETLEKQLSEVAKSHPKGITLQMPWVKMMLVANAPIGPIHRSRSTKSNASGASGDIMISPVSSRGFAMPGLVTLLRHCFSYALLSDHVSVSKLKDKFEGRMENVYNTSMRLPSSGTRFDSMLPFIEMELTHENLSRLERVLRIHSFPTVWSHLHDYDTPFKSEGYRLELARTQFGSELFRGFGNFDGTKRDSRVNLALRIMFHLCHHPQGYKAVKEMSDSDEASDVFDLHSVSQGAPLNSSIGSVFSAFHDLRKKQKQQRMDIRLDLAVREAQQKLVHGREAKLVGNLGSNELSTGAWSGMSKDDVTVSTGRVFSFNIPEDNEVPFSVVYGTTSGLTTLDHLPSSVMGAFDENNVASKSVIENMLTSGGRGAAASNTLFKVVNGKLKLPKSSETLAEVTHSRRLKMTPSAEATVLRTIEEFRREEEEEEEDGEDEVSVEEGQPRAFGTGKKQLVTTKGKDSRKLTHIIPSRMKLQPLGKRSRPRMTALNVHHKSQKTGDTSDSLAKRFDIPERTVPTPAYAVAWPPIPGIDPSPNTSLLTSGFIPRGIPNPLLTCGKAAESTIAEPDMRKSGSGTGHFTMYSKVLRGGAGTVPISTATALANEARGKTKRTEEFKLSNMALRGVYEDDIDFEFWSDSDEEEKSTISRGSQSTPKPWIVSGSGNTPSKPKAKYKDPRLNEYARRPKDLRCALKYDAKKLADATAEVIKENERLLGHKAHLQLRRESYAMNKYLHSLFGDDAVSDPASLMEVIDSSDEEVDSAAEGLRSYTFNGDRRAKSLIKVKRR